jgi:regulatory protein
MAGNYPSSRKKYGKEPRVLKPLDAARIEEMALAYVARFATTAAKLAQYLGRKLRERGWADEAGIDPDFVGELIAKLVAAGYVDDTGYAHSRSGSLQRRGFGKRRISQDLGQAGIAADIMAEALPDGSAARMAALACAKKRGIGPFARGRGAEDMDRMQLRALREKQMAAMLRAGHPLDFARELVNADSVEAAEEWAAEECVE